MIPSAPSQAQGPGSDQARRFRCDVGPREVHGDGEKTRRYRDLQSATTKTVVERNALQIEFGGAKPDDLNDRLSFSTKEVLKAVTVLTYAK